MVHRWLVAALSLLAVIDAFVRFDHSMIYDEVDFAGQKSISVPLSCTETGCRIYISMPEASKGVASNLMIADKITLRTRFSDVALMKQIDGQKGFYNIKKGNQFVNFTNQNADLKSAPIMLWILQGDAPHISDTQVYDAALFYRSPTRAGLVTVMSAEPFTLTTDTRGPMTVSAKLAGFDLFDDEACTTVLQQGDPSTYQELDLSVRSPLITVSFDGVGFPDTTVAMTAKLEMVDSFDLGKQMFATSPGFVCAASERGYGNGTASFRSSLYDAATEYRFVSDRTMQVDISAEVNVQESNAVIITDQSTDSEYRWWGSIAEGTSQCSMELRTMGLTIDWNRGENDEDQYFLVRVVPVPAPAGTTSSMPEGEESKTTTIQQQIALETTTAGSDYSTSEPNSSITSDLVKVTTATRRTIPPTSQKLTATSSRPKFSSSLSTSTISSPTTSTAVQGCSLVLASLATWLFL